MNLDSITNNRNPILDNELSNKKIRDVELNDDTILRLEKT